MIKAVVTDFSRVLLFPKDENYGGSLNLLNNTLLDESSEYNFWEHFILNEELLNYYASLALPVYIFTSDIIQNHPAIKDRLNTIFKGVLSAKELRVSKANTQAYALIARKLQQQPKEIIYIDDQQANIIAAQNAGFRIIRYQSNKDVIDKII